MKVTVSVWARFHAFYLARELHAHGFLQQLITTYPAFEAKKYGVPPDRISSVVWVEVLNRLLRRLPERLLRAIRFPFKLVDFYDRLVSRRIPRDTEVFVAWSGVAEHSMRVAGALGAVTILERGSTHIETAERLLKEEYARQGLWRTEAIDGRFREKEKREYAAADFIAIPSSHVEQSFIENGIPRSKLIQVPYGVDVAHFSPGDKKDDAFRIIHCGTLSLRKGIPYLLEAFTDLALPHSELWLVGPVLEEAKPSLEKYASSQIKVLGPFPEFELREYYAQASVYCLMSIEEGMAMTLLQAMACGLPAIATNFTGGQDVIREGVDGFILEPRNVDKLKEKLTYLYKNPQAAAAMGAAATQNIAKNFTWARYGERAIAGYTAALAQRRAAAGGHG